MSVALYARISTDDQVRGYSIDDQVNWGQEWCKTRNIEPLTVYRDIVAHSDTFDREDLQRLCHAVAEGKVKILLLKYHDRLGRGSVFSKLVEWLKAWQVRIICGDLPEVEGDATDILLGIYASMGGIFLKTLRARTKEGMVRAKKGGKHSGRTLLGFRWEDNQWKIEPWAEQLERGVPVESVVLNGKRVEMKRWRVYRILTTVRAFRAGRLNEFVESHTEASGERHQRARQKQELAAREFEGWLLQHRPLTYDRVSL